MSTPGLLRQRLWNAGWLVLGLALFFWTFAVPVVCVSTDEPMAGPVEFRVGGHQTVVSGLEPGASRYVLIYGFNEGDTSLEVAAGLTSWIEATRRRSPCTIRDSRINQEPC